MPFMKNGRRDYKREVALYTSKPEVKKKRAEQNAARRTMVEKGLARKGDGRDIDHKTPLSKGGTNSPRNLRSVPASQNRSFSRNSDGSLKSQTSRKERRK